MGQVKIVPGAAGGAAGLGVEHESKQAQSFGFGGRKLDGEAGEEQGLLRQVPAGGVGALRVAPTFGKGRVDGFQHGIEPGRQGFAAGDCKGDAGLADLVLGPHQPLAHGGGRGEEG